MLRILIVRYVALLLCSAATLLLHCFSIPCQASYSETYTVSYMGSTVHLECSASITQPTPPELILIIDPGTLPPGLSLAFLDGLVILDLPSSSTAGLAKWEYARVGSEKWLPATPCDLTEVADMLPQEALGRALLDSAIQAMGSGTATSDPAALTRAVAQTLNPGGVFVEPPRALSAAPDTTALGWIVLLSEDGEILKEPARPPYKLRLHIPLTDAATECRLPTGYASFLIALRHRPHSEEAHAGVTEISNQPVTYHHVSFRFAGSASSAAALGRPAPEAPLTPSPDKAAKPPYLVSEQPASPSFDPRADMILIPAGTFTMGSSDFDRAALASERPQHEVNLGAFYIARTPVTNYQYRQFVAATGFQTQGIWQKYDGPGLEHYPVRAVSYHDALEYCRWAGVRLPTEAEWEKAMRGSYGQIYPWGNEFDHSRLAVGELYAVGEFPSGASPYGVLDGVGGVWEWTASAYAPYPFAADSAEGVARVLRGGAWMNERKYLRVAARWGESPNSFTKATGFRCAIDAISAASAQQARGEEPVVSPPSKAVF